MFEPKRVVDRSAKLANIQQQQLQQYQEFVHQFTQQLQQVQGQQGANTVEHLFLQLWQGLQIRTDQKKYPFSLLLFNADMYVLEYNWKANLLCCHFELVWLPFNQVFHIEYAQWQQFMCEQLTRHFGLQQPKLLHSLLHEIASVEQHFKQPLVWTVNVANAIFI